MFSTHRIGFSIPRRIDPLVTVDLPVRKSQWQSLYLQLFRRFLPYSAYLHWSCGLRARFRNGSHRDDPISVLLPHLLKLCLGSRFESPHSEALLFRSLTLPALEELELPIPTDLAVIDAFKSLLSRSATTLRKIWVKNMHNNMRLFQTLFRSTPSLAFLDIQLIRSIDLTALGRYELLPHLQTLCLPSQVTVENEKDMIAMVESRRPRRFHGEDSRSYLRSLTFVFLGWQDDYLEARLRQIVYGLGWVKDGLKIRFEHP